MNGLALCAGIGGIELGVKLVCPSYRTICYVEREAYNAACLVQRMEEGFLDKAPIWDDIRTFTYSALFCGKVDIITAGLPCQPFSTAGKRQGEKDERHLWPSLRRVIKFCHPSFVFLENVSIKAFKEPFRDLRRMGFEMPNPYACTAAELGAPHIRRRVFALAYRSGVRIQLGRSSRKSRTGQEVTLWSGHREPGIPRMDVGYASRVDKNRALGNAVVPAMAAKAFRSLMNESQD